MQDTRMIEPDDFFRAAWLSDRIKVVDLAALYGTSRMSIYRAARRSGLGRRRAVERPEGQARVSDGNYGDDLISSRGRWSILREISETYGKTLTQVQADFHRARTNAK